MQGSYRKILADKGYQGATETLRVNYLKTSFQSSPLSTPERDMIFNISSHRVILETFFEH